LHYKS